MVKNDHFWGDPCSRDIFRNSLTKWKFCVPKCNFGFLTYYTILFGLSEPNKTGPRSLGCDFALPQKLREGKCSKNLQFTLLSEPKIAQLRRQFKPAQIKLCKLGSRSLWDLLSLFQGLPKRKFSFLGLIIELFEPNSSSASSMSPGPGSLGCDFAHPQKLWVGNAPEPLFITY